jgi:hypothetical protein
MKDKENVKNCPRLREIKPEEGQEEPSDPGLNLAPEEKCSPRTAWGSWGQVDGLCELKLLLHQC